MNSVKLAIAPALGAAFLFLAPMESFAGPEGYCDAYARDVANRKSRNVGADILAGAAFGAITGAAISDMGEGGDAMVVEPEAGAADKRWRRAYGNTYDACIIQYRQEKVVEEPKQALAQEPADDQADAPAEVPVEEVVEEVVEAPVEKPAKAKGKPRPGTQAWNNYCESRYRSFNAKTGLYKSHTGKYRKCQ